jgi:hypothetical protein
MASSSRAVVGLQVLLVVVSAATAIEVWHFYYFVSRPFP